MNHRKIRQSGPDVLVDFATGAMPSDHRGN